MAMLNDDWRKIRPKWLHLQTNLDNSMHDTSIHIAAKCEDGYAILSINSLNVGYDGAFLGMKKQEVLHLWYEEIIKQLAELELEKE